MRVVGRNGLLLAGGSGSGKSTLSLALAQAGFDYLSDDRTLVSSRSGTLLAWGLSSEMKHCADAVEHFPVLRNMTPGEMWKGEPVFRFDPVQCAGVSRDQCCEPRWIVFLERQTEPAFSVTGISADDAMQRLLQDLHQETSEAAERQRQAIEALCQTERCCLRYGGSPHTTAGALRALVEGDWSGNRAASTFVSRRLAPTETQPADPLRRFRATPLHSDLYVMTRTIRLETNSPVVLKQVIECFKRYAPVVSGPAQSTWKIVCESREDSDLSWPPLTAFGDQTLRYINVGQRSFIAVDLQAREAVGVLPEHLAQDEAGFLSVFLGSLFYLTAPALGLIAVSAACVAAEDRGLLMFGPPKSGKTTSSYWAQKLGLDFHADQATSWNSTPVKCGRGATFGRHRSGRKPQSLFQSRQSGAALLLSRQTSCVSIKHRQPRASEKA